MKIKASVLVGARPSAGWLGSQLLDPGTALQVQRNVKNLNEFFEQYSKQEKSLYEKHGKEVTLYYDKDGKEVDESDSESEKTDWKVPPENRTAFEDDLKLLSEAEIEISIQPIKFTDFERKNREIKIAGLILLALEFMFEFPEQAEEKPGRKRHPSKKD